MRWLIKRVALSSLLAVGLLTQLAAGAPFRSFRIPTSNSQPMFITLGPDGNMWFTDASANQIGRIDPMGNITEFVVPQADSAPMHIVAGADGALWFTEASGFPEGIGRITTDGVFTGFAPGCAGGQPCSLTPQGIAATPDGYIWFTDFISNSVVKLDPSTGTMTFFRIPTNGSPAGITLGPDGALWFAEPNGGQIGRMDTAGNFTMFGPVSGVNGADRITAGPDGNLWFTQPFDNMIGRITPSGG